MPEDGSEPRSGRCFVCWGHVTLRVVRGGAPASAVPLDLELDAHVTESSIWVTVIW
jgi:hypothetical protein